jgi:hypothetical protein
MYFVVPKQLLTMKKTTLTLTFIGMAALIAILLTQCKPKDKPANDNVNLPPDSLCLVQPSWFPHSQTPAPEEGIGSPFDTSSTTNQIFHQWSWNKFLWLTKPDVGTTPLFLNQAKCLQVTSSMQLVKVPADVLLVIQDINQAGSDGILQTNPDYNNGNGDTVFYSIHMNPQMYKAGLAFGDSLAKKLLDSTNLSSFPVGSFELKVAWVPTTAIPASKLPNYYTAMASLSRDGGKTFANTNMALIGMHVVGVVQNHPEFIWATFEHNDLAPNYDWKKNNASSDTEKLLFKKGSVTGINGILYDTTTQLGVTPYQAFDLYQYGIPVNSNGDSLMVTSQSEPINFNNVQGINKCVQGQLNDVWKNYFYNGSIWLNTDGKNPMQQAKLIDSLGYGIDKGTTPGSFARGSLNCANVTMETYTQTFQNNIGNINVSNLANCFSCHSGVSFSSSNGRNIVSPIYMSHSFQLYLLAQKKPIKEAEAIKLDAERKVFKRLRLLVK